MLITVRQLAGPTAYVTGAKVAGGVSLLALNVWLARQFGPSAFGWFALASTAALLVDGVVGSAIDAAVIRMAAPAPGRALTAWERHGVVCKIVAGAMLVGLAAAIARAVAGGSAAGLFALAMIAGSGLLVLRSVLVYFQLRQQFGRYAVVDLAHTAARWVGVVTAASVFASPAAVVAAWAAAAWVIAGIALAIVGRHPAQAVSEAQGSALDLIRASRLPLATTGVGAIVARLDLFLVGAFASATDAGIFGAAAALAMAPTTLGAYLAPVFSGRIMPYCREQRLRPLLRDVQRGLLVLAVAGVAVGAVAGPLLIEWLLPAEYTDASAVMQVLLIAGAAGFVTFPLVLHTLLFLSPRTYLLMDLASIPVLLPAYVIAAERSGAIGVAWVSAVAAVAKAAIAQLSAAAAVRREQERFTTLQQFSTVAS